jgi:cyclic pyranopterin phosphate synthase
MAESAPTRLIDSCNRHLNYLRVSITDRCNLSCMYCLPRESLPRLAHEDILRYEEILRIVRVAVGLGITKVRVTGGEPLVRNGVYEFLLQLAAVPGLIDISLTTNGVLLKDNLHRLRAAGIARLNISIDTLKPERYRAITGTDVFEQVWDGVRAAEALGFHPIKLNAVALKGVNDDELVELARLSFDHPYHVRFIEFMPIGKSRWAGRPPLLMPEIQERLRVLGELTPVPRSEHDGPAALPLQGSPGGDRFHPGHQSPFLRPLQPPAPDGQRPAPALPALRPPGGPQGAAAPRVRGCGAGGDFFEDHPAQALGA